MKKVLVYVLILSMVMSMFVGCSQNSPEINNQIQNNQEPITENQTIKFNAGTYVGEAEGMKGPIVVEVKVDEKEIIDVKVLEHMDSERLFNFANESIPSAILENQSVAVDLVSGATMSSIGILKMNLEVSYQK